MWSFCIHMYKNVSISNIVNITIDSKTGPTTVTTHQDRVCNEEANQKAEEHGLEPQGGLVGAKPATNQNVMKIQINQSNWGEFNQSKCKDISNQNACNFKCSLQKLSVW